jgi:hypothetical protein
MIMNGHFAKLGLALVLPFLLLGCVLTPGKFVSTLTINADRSFTYAYKGEVYAVDPSAAMSDLSESSDDDKSANKKTTGAAAAKAATKQAEADVKNREIATALAKETGYRSVSYAGKGKFLIDYSLSGVLTHSFVFPYNSDAEAVFPFIAVELRQGGIVRVKAPGFANDSSKDKTGGMAGGASTSAAALLDGTFTIDTNAEFVSQNNEAGVTKAGARSTVTWRATALTKDAPTAVLRLAK